MSKTNVAIKAPQLQVVTDALATLDELHARAKGARRAATAKLRRVDPDSDRLAKDGKREYDSVTNEGD